MIDPLRAFEIYHSWALRNVQLKRCGTGIPIDSDGLMTPPYWSGCMNPQWDPDARGCMVGWFDTIEDAAAAMSARTTAVEPNPRNAARYAELMALQGSLYAANAAVFQGIRAFERDSASRDGLAGILR